MVPVAELRGAWLGIRYATTIIRTNRIVLEGDSSIVSGWVRRHHCSIGTHLLLMDIWRMVEVLASFEVTHIFRKANGAMDWVASHMASHSVNKLWGNLSTIPGQFQNILYLDSWGCIYTRVRWHTCYIHIKDDAVGAWRIPPYSHPKEPHLTPTQNNRMKNSPLQVESIELILASSVQYYTISSSRPNMKNSKEYINDWIIPDNIAEINICRYYLKYIFITLPVMSENF